jgi:hypothetical protein
VPKFSKTLAGLTGQFFVKSAAAASTAINTGSCFPKMKQYAANFISHALALFSIRCSFPAVRVAGIPVCPATLSQPPARAG